MQHPYITKPFFQHLRLTDLNLTNCFINSNKDESDNKKRSTSAAPTIGNRPTLFALGFNAKDKEQAKKINNALNDKKSTNKQPTFSQYKDIRPIPKVI